MPLAKSVEVLELDALDCIWRNGDAARPEQVDIHTNDGAYVIYTLVSFSRFPVFPKDVYD